MIKLTPEVLKEVAGNLADISNEMEAICKRMNKLIDDLEEKWPDEVGKEFISRFRSEVSVYFPDFYGNVQQFSNFVNSAYSDYSKEIEEMKKAVHYRA